ncbi:MAG: HxlR family transcriptional regulator [Kaistia sp. SCN 65-12]|jgi:DNA-binding HxlR family transcriptional regulator|nr:helix-turn-helix transcriptional regulator [Devosia sp.]ODT06948.1 MAG: HxlR family transcriptional regulator [Kaistia sp. SCN 65-12]
MQQVPYVCGLGPAIDVISGKWKALLLWAIAEKPCRFGELKRAVPGITEKMLIQHLRELEADGIVHREVFHEIPPKVVYSATELGASLNKALEPLGAWGDAHITEISARRQRKAAAISPGAESM